MNLLTLRANIQRKQNPALVTVKAPQLWRKPSAEMASLKNTPRIQFVGILQGIGCENKFATVTYRILVGKELARKMATHCRGTADLDIYPALAALWRIGHRHRFTGKVEVSGDEQRMIEDGLDMADALQDETTRKEHTDAYKAVLSMVGSMEYTMKTLEPYAIP